MSDIPPFEIRVVDFFRFGDGSTVFTGELVGDTKVITPCRVELVVDDEHVAYLNLGGERMPGPKTPKGHRIVFTRDNVPTNLERLGTVVLIHK